jgi:pimeloyl-ACP methyl ester carboxylesterase
VKTQVALAGLGIAVAHRAARGKVLRARTQPDRDLVSHGAGRPVRQSFVHAPDGARLAVNEWGDPHAPVTVVLLHGWTLSSRLWSRQIAVLSQHARVVAYDHRGHGRSDRGLAESCTLDQLGADLAAVVDTVAPEGRLVLAGHSMGGMTLMHLAEQRPALVAERVDGVVIVSSSAGELSRSDFGLPGPLGVGVRVLGPSVMAMLGRLESWAERHDALAPELWLAIRALCFGRGAPAHLVDEMLAVVQDVPLGVVSAFYAGLALHDGTPGLRALMDTPATILVGTEDRLTPVSHSMRIAKALPQAELTTFEGAGHMLTLERADEVADAICRHVSRRPAADEAGDHLVAR